MPEVVSFTAPGEVALVACEPRHSSPGRVRVRTWYSGISAGTELTAYRGSNPYLTSTWDAERRLFVAGRRRPSPTPSRAGATPRSARSSRSPTTSTAPAVGDVVHGIWGHRSDAVVPAAAVAWRGLAGRGRPLGHVRPGRLDRAQRRARRRRPAGRPGRGLRPGGDRAAGHPAGHARRAPRWSRSTRCPRRLETARAMGAVEIVDAPTRRAAPAPPSASGRAAGSTPRSS